MTNIATDAIVEKTSLPFAKTVLSITPPVPRRKGWRDDETSIFYIRFRTVEGRNEVRGAWPLWVVIKLIFCR